ncbi:hypothetical protein M406DRAFT_338265 [Cryphonectria parasitica EP155]|uniref:DNA polymerase delta subunit 3 n=1 Tax=Cryphonectria parasitica (strain ATCC 38755 / EP155) TaxID=660469 RepID=A0A9P4Y5X5_CRYP1|nr:uncharacterized protein M406DRAFT_338265 [Cryphonectria parasitica EP155]KAF3767512.1 hypothetical protein M406DRAFT_338265 [Cryphonectria parasitica EP155]
MEDYRKYLAEQVVSEGKIITYRTLSRALGVNVNIAKQMLYDYHGWQNGKRSGAVHATYMIYGNKKSVHTNGHSQQDGDVEMTSSPPEPMSVAEEVPVMTLSLVAEENLKDVLSLYENVVSLHVYSLSAHQIKDMQILSDSAKPVPDVGTEGVHGDQPKITAPIHNPHVRRRERREAARVAAAPVSKPVGTKPAPSKPAPAATVKEEPKVEQKPLSKESTPVSSGTKKPAPKRGAPGGIMQSFAKAASKPKRAENSQSATSTAADDSSMPTLSDDGEDDSITMSEPKKASDTGRKTKKDRQEELKRMMEESSEDEEPEKEDTPMEEPEEEPAAPQPEDKADEEPAEVVSSTGNGRRRGRRRVLKKKTAIDDKGYLVTIQEPGWESFSEDEAAAPAKKKTETAVQPAKAKKPAPKGQGNIMSFFGKK